MIRTRIAEIMDDPQLDPKRHQAALRGLERLNTFSAGLSVISQPIEALSRDVNGRPLRILDIASGGGDLPIGLAALALKTGLPLEVVGSDCSATAIAFAQEKARQLNQNVKFIHLNALNDALPSDFDIISTSLFTHHLDPEEVINLLRKAYLATRSLVIVNDLERSAINFGLVWVATRLLTQSDVVWHDGPVSVRASYTQSEFQELAKQAGLKNCQITAKFPCRFQFVARKS
jgi:2-polyprenyl-3-methyl-5-hydroxy-6-metoxy-1,4-benzoquinol methylase